MRTRSGLDAALAIWRRRKWLMLPCFLILLAATAGLAGALPDIYESTATVLVGARQDPERSGDPAAMSELETRLRTIGEQVLSRGNLAGLIARFDLYPHERPRATPEDLAERMRRDVRLDFTQVRDRFGWWTRTVTVVISYRSRDPESAAAVTNALARQFVAEHAQLQVLDSALPSRTPVAPSRVVIMLMGVMLSAGTAAGAGVLAEARDTSFHTVDDLRTFTSVPVLAAVPRIVTRRDAWRRGIRFALAAVGVGLAAAAAGAASSRLAHGSELLARILSPDRF